MSLIAGGPKTPDRVPLVTTSPASYGENDRTRFMGVLYECATGTTTHDLTLTDSVKLMGGAYWVKGPHLGDRVTLQVVDVDGVLGPPDTVVSEYVTNLPVAPWDHIWEIQSPTAASIPSGLHLRVVYLNTGADPVQIGVTYRWMV